MELKTNYRTDLTETQWQIIKKWIPWQKKGPKQICRRRIINAILFVVRTGCQWRNLPSDFPKWKTIYHVF
ncbi:MAG: transposase [Planctomycetaceae bacterium]|nr:transposase [Planctomycetaceae bacterium]